MKKRPEEDDDDLSERDESSGADEKKFSDELLNEGGEDRDERRKKVKAILDDQDAAYLETSRLLWQIRENEDYTKWGYPDFDTYVETECVFKERKGKYLADLWQKFRIELGLEPKKLSKIGWWKVSIIKPVVTLDNHEEWLDKARTMSARDLQKAVKEAMGGKPETDLKPFTVKLSPSQRENVETALSVCGTESGNPEAMGYNMDLIMLEWQAQHVKAKEKPGFLIEQFERVYGVKFLAMDKKYFKRVTKMAEKIIKKMDDEEKSGAKKELKAALKEPVEEAPESTAAKTLIDGLKAKSAEKKEASEAVKEAAKSGDPDATDATEQPKVKKFKKKLKNKASTDAPNAGEEDKPKKKKKKFKKKGKAEHGSEAESDEASKGNGATSSGEKSEKKDKAGEGVKTRGW